MRKVAFLALAVSLVGFSASAATVNTATCATGAASCVASGATVTASGPAGSFITLIDFRGNSALGVGQNNANGRPREIQGENGEELTVTFDKLSFIDTVILAAFYNPSEFNSDPQEIALITGFFADSSSQTLSIRNNSNALNDFTVNDASLFSTITRLDEDKGRVQISNLFGGFGPISKLVFAAADTPKGNDNSDYGVELVSATPVPLPAAGWMLVAGVSALVAAGRRRRA